MKKRLLLIAVALVFSMNLASGQEQKTLKFRADGTFKIVQFTDLHVKLGEKQSKVVIENIKKILVSQKPDLVVFTGDVVLSNKYKEAWDWVLRPVEESKTPFAVVFGNHDDEHGISREVLSEYIKTYSYSLMVTKIEGVKGYGNYYVPVKSSRTDVNSAGLWFMDSNSYSTIENVQGYGWFDLSQINWYKKQSELNTRENNGKPIPSVAFFHIPLPEYKISFDDKKNMSWGKKEEDECPPQLNSGMFTQLLTSGDVMATFCGHDHDNDYVTLYYNILLCYGRYSGGENHGPSKSGARVVTLKEGERKFETYYIEDGSNEKRDVVNIPYLQKK